jgi:putative colanic acid biosynthesis glycosyltransferase
MVARQLHTSLTSEGHASRILYGYGPKGGRSAAEAAAAPAGRLSSKPRALGNLLIHKAVGIDALRPARAVRNRLSNLLDEADVIHLHAIHSHFVPYRWLVGELERAKKPVLWTMHDSWLATGRCAIPGNCTRWQTGCGHCPSRRAYPSGLLDLTAQEAISKRRSVDMLKNRLTLVSCSRWMAKRMSTVFPELDIRVITNGVDPAFESAADRLASAPGPRDKKAKVLVVGADLSDPVKHDPQILSQLAELTDLTLSLVGAHPPALRGSVEHHGQISDRGQLAMMLSNAHALVFTSLVDNFPLAVAEALLVGTPALCLDSPGTREVLGMVMATPYSTSEKLIQALANREWFRGYAASHSDQLRTAAKAAYSGEQMFRRYLGIYESLL